VYWRVPKINIRYHKRLCTTNNDTGIFVAELNLFMQNQSYSYVAQAQVCHSAVFVGEFPHWWDWLQYANYTGQTNVRGFDCQTWQLNMSSAEALYLYVAVGGGSDPVPVREVYSLAGDLEIYDVIFWQPKQPDSDHFRIPSFCTPPQKGSPVVDNDVGTLKDMDIEPPGTFWRFQPSHL